MGEISDTWLVVTKYIATRVAVALPVGLAVRYLTGSTF